MPQFHAENQLGPEAILFSTVACVTEAGRCRTTKQPADLTSDDKS